MNSTNQENQEDQFSSEFDGMFDRTMGDESVEKYQFVEQTTDESITAQMNAYKITLRDVDSWVGLADAFIKCVLHLKTSTGGVVNATDTSCALQNVGANIFDRVELRAGDQKLDACAHLGLTQLITGLSSKSADYERSTATVQGWDRDTAEGAADKSKYLATANGTDAAKENPAYNA